MKKLVFLIHIIIFHIHGFAQTETVLLKTVDSLTALKKFDAAILIYSKILKQNPKSEKALTGRGWLYISTNKLNLAEKDYTDAVKISPACIDCYTKLAWIKLSQNDNAAAISLTEKALQLDDKNSRAWLMKGRISLSEKKYKDAAFNINRSISLDSNNSDAFYSRAVLFIRTELFESALKDLAFVNHLAPDFAEAYYEAGAIYGNQKKLEEALNYFLLAIQNDSINGDYYKAAGNVSLSKEDISGAIKYFSKAIKLDNKDPEAYAGRAEANYSLEDMDASCRDFKTALAILTPEKDRAAKEQIQDRMSEFCDSAYAEYYYQRGIAGYNLKQFDKAIVWYNRGLVKFPQHCMLTSFRGNAWLALDEYGKAEADYTQALALKDKLAEETGNSIKFKKAGDQEKQVYIINMIADNYRHRADTRLSLNNYSGAMEDIDEALNNISAMVPDKEVLYNTKGSIYLAQEDNNNALAWFNKAIQLSPGYAMALVNRAIVKFNLAYKISVLSSETFTRSTQGLNSQIKRAGQNNTTIIKDNIESALSDCNKAIAADPLYAYAFYIRAVVKMSLEQGDYCYDLLKSEQLGFASAKAVIEEMKCR